MSYLDLQSFEESEPTLRRYFEKVAPTLEIYASMQQTGIRKGSSLYQHLMNGAFFLGSVLPKLGFEDAEIELALAAFTIHDANKMMGEASLKKVVYGDSFEELVKKHALIEFLGEDRISSLRVLAVNTSHVHGAIGELLLRPEKERFQLERLRAVLMAADVHDLSHTFEETFKKEDLLRHLIAATKKPLRLSWHRMAEQLGPFSALVHSACAEAALEKGVIPIWVYPEGSWYIGEADLQVSAEDVFRWYKKLREKVLGGIKSFIEKTKDGIKPFLSTLERWNDAELAVELEDVCRSPLPVATFKNLTTKRIPVFKGQLIEGTNWPTRVEDVAPGTLWLSAENLLKNVPNFKEKPSTYLVKQLIPELEPLLSIGLDPIYEQPYVLMASVTAPWEIAKKAMEMAAKEARRLSGRVLGKTQLPEELSHYLQAAICWSGGTKDLSLMTGALKRYIEGERSSLGAAWGPVSDLMSREVLGKTPVSQFSNSQLGGSREPKRQRDALQAEIQDMLVRSSPNFPDSPPRFIHLFPNAATLAGWQATTQGLAARSARAERNAFTTRLEIRKGQITTEWKDLFFGLLAPGERALQGNGMTLCVAPNPNASDIGTLLDAVELGVGLWLDTQQSVVISPLPVVEPPKEPIRIEGVPTLIARLLETKDPIALLRRVAALSQLNRELRPKLDKDVRLQLAAATGPIQLYAVMDRFLEKRLEDTTGWTAIHTVATLLPLLSELESCMNPTPVSSYLKQMAEIAVESHLKGKDFKRNDLLRPINETFKAIRRSRSEDAELALAAAEDRIFTALETIRERDGYSVGRSTREAVRHFITLFRQLLTEGYGGNIARLRSDERILRSAFITFVRAGWDARQANKNLSSQE